MIISNRRNKFASWLSSFTLRSRNFTLVFAVCCWSQRNSLIKSSFLVLCGHGEQQCIALICSQPRLHVWGSFVLSQSPSEGRGYTRCTGSVFSDGLAPQQTISDLKDDGLLGYYVFKLLLSVRVLHWFILRCYKTRIVNENYKRKDIFKHGFHYIQEARRELAISLHTHRACTHAQRHDGKPALCAEASVVYHGAGRVISRPFIEVKKLYA